MDGGQLLENFTRFIIDPAILVIFAAGFFLFVWGLVQFLINLDKGSENKEGKQHMLWGFVGMFIMASVYAIVALLNNTFDLDAYNPNPDTSRWQDFDFEIFK